MDSTNLAEIDPEAAALVGTPSVRKQPTDTLVTAEELAEWLGLSRRRIDELTVAGVLTRAARARYALRPSILAYCADQRSKTSGRGRADPAYTAAKTRAAEATAEKLETANALARRELIPAVEVEREWSAILRDVRGQMLSLPSRLQQRLGHLTTHDVTTIDREIRDTLEEIAHDRS
jgi:phage terminase Nu1 subunit (DNA packaging protein)